VTVGAQYDFTLLSHDAFIRADDEYMSRRTRPVPEEDPRTAYYDAGLVPDPATNQLSLRAGMTFDRFDLAIYAENLLDSHPQLDLQHQDSGTALYEATTLRPLTVGLAANYKF
jgi:outer membrane receptor protein involved in Fe transport